MKIRHPLLVGAIGATGAAVVRRLGRTLRYHFRYQDPAVAPEIARETGQRYIYAFFHEVMLFPAYYWPWSEMHILISDHRDGELITQVVGRLGFSVIRGSTTRGGTRALWEMTMRVDQGHLCVTPDGPAVPGARSIRGWRISPAGPGFRSSEPGWPSSARGGPGAGTDSASPGPSAPPPVWCRPRSSSRPTPIARPSKPAAWKSSVECNRP